MHPAHAHVHLKAFGQSGAQLLESEARLGAQPLEQLHAVLGGDFGRVRPARFSWRNALAGFRLGLDVAHPRHRHTEALSHLGGALPG